MTPVDAFTQAMARLPLVAILRGVRPDEIEAIGEELVAAGFALIEVPLNSPDPFESIARLVRRIGDRAVIGAGTVLCPTDVARLAGIGARMVISPNADATVIAAAAGAGLVSLPGIFTPSEAFAALAAGATALKLFPAEAANPDVVKAMRAVLPAGTMILPVGGMNPANMAPWREVGAAGFGLGSALYRVGANAADVRIAADRFVAEWQRTTSPATVQGDDTPPPC